jgi:two-component system response regulator YesN
MVLHINEITLKNPAPEADTTHEKEFLDKIKYSISMNIEDETEKLLNSFIERSGNQIDEIYASCYDFSLQLRKALESQEIADNPVPQARDLNRQIFSRTTLMELKGWLIHQTEQCLEAVKAARKSRENDVVAEAKKYILKHFSEQITLNKMASIVFMSPTHFCMLFKNRMGIGFHEFLMKVRMEEAVRLMSSKTIKVYEVAEKVGFKNPRYFSEAFKRFYGVIPTEYIAK